MDEILNIRDLTVAFKIDRRYINVIESISFSVKKGETIALVGESGSGKSVTARSVMRLIPEKASKVIQGEILLEGEDLLRLKPPEMRKIRGNRISMIFQEPMTSLNPVYTCGNQIIEPLMLHQKLNKEKAREQAIDMLRLVGIQEPEKRYSAYPHQLSGGMRQRVMIAMALACHPDLLIADEPTTALDPTIQAQIIELCKELQNKIGMSIIYITHDLGIVASICDRVVVMYAGSVMESSTVRDLFKNPAHPYTKGLLQAIPRPNNKKERLFAIEGVVPPLQQIPRGCPFEPRCNKRMVICSQQRSPLISVANNHDTSCWLYSTN